MKQKIILSSLILFTFFHFSCERDMQVEGPLLEDLYADLNIVESFKVSEKTVDFEAGQSLYFTMKFNKQANWKLTITGLESKGKKEFSGLSREIDITNSTWIGEVTTLPMFREEICLADLYLAEIDSHYFDTIQILKTKVNTGFLVEDFEGTLNRGWKPFIQQGANMSFRIVNDSSAAQGNGYYDMGGTVNWDYLIGMQDIPASAYGVSTFPLGENPDNVYFNVMLYSPPGITNAIVLFQFREDENGDGQFTEASEDLYSIEIKEFVVGWQLVSIPYSQLTSLANGEEVAAKGNNIKEPNKLWQISVLMLADPATGYSQTWMDYMIFTENGPLKP